MSRERRPKSPWYTKSRKEQEKWKQASPTLPPGAREPGKCYVDKGRSREAVGPYPVCLPIEHADRNLLPGIRETAIERFSRHGIEWHMWSPAPGGGRWPSTHLLDSQVQCVNVLLSLAAQPGLLLDFVRQVEPAATGLVAVEDDSPVAFEWIGEDDYLGEGRGRPRHRGRFATAADAFLVVEREDGGRTGILVEWKFTETYPDPLPFRGPGGTDRRDVYRDALGSEDTPFAEKPAIEAFFHEPHYQLMRQALLAAGMVGNGEKGIDRAVLAHLIPAGNRALRATVPGGLAPYGMDVAEVWARLLPGPGVTYSCLDSAPLFLATPELQERYGAPATRP